MRLSDGQHYKRCYGWKMDKRNGGQNLMSRKILRCLLNYKMQDGEYVMQLIVERLSKRVSHLLFTMNCHVGKNIVMDAYVHFPFSKSNFQAELMFHPMKFWWRRGPFTPLFRQFLKSNIKGASKFTIMAYIGTYCTLPSFVLIN